MPAGSWGPGVLQTWHRLRPQPKAHVTMSGNSRRQKASPCDPARTFITTSPPWSAKADAHRAAFSKKNGSWVPATT